MTKELTALEILARITDDDVAKLIGTTCKPGGGGNGHVVLFMAERNLLSATCMARHALVTQS